MLLNLIVLAVSLFFVVQCATLATRYAVRLAESFRISKYVVGFIIVAVISIMPETFISINSAIAGMPSFGLGTLFGSNVADLTFVFAVIIAISGRGIKIQSTILKNNAAYPFLLLIPLMLGFDGYYSRLEGAALIVTGAIFYYLAFKNGFNEGMVRGRLDHRAKNLCLLVSCMAVLLAGSHYTVISASALAADLGISPILIAMLIVGLGTTMPELLFSLKSVQRNDDALALGDVLGTVLADATVVVGILALISPFSFPQKTIYITGTFMVFAAFLLFSFMRSGKILSKKEGGLLFAFWMLFACGEFFLNI
ncbi:MAG: hypothetical protein PHI63_00005 [Patescibacteria group bacterium]|nr:hypothetical protein [Patescibacteria group bacterium]